MRFIFPLLAAVAAYGQSTNTNLLTVIPKTDLSATGELHFRDKQTTPHYVGLKAADSITANQMFTMPAATAVGCVQDDGTGTWTISSCGAAAVVNGFQVTGSTAVMPPVTTVGWQAWYRTSDHSTNWLSYDNANALSPINLSASAFNITAATVLLTGNALANAVNTQSVGSKTTPFKDGYFMSNVSTKQVEIYGQSATDLNGGFMTITGDLVVVPGRVRMYFNDAASIPMLTLSRIVAATTVNQAIFDLNLFPNINSNGSTGYDIGASSFLWRDIYWAGRLIQNGTTRLDASGNLTVNSCSGCGGVQNGFFMTGKTTVSPPSVATGVQMWFDPSPNYQAYLKAYNNSATLVPFNLSSSVLNLTDGGISFGTVGTQPVGTGANPGSQAWFLTSVETRSLNLHGPASSDLTGGSTSITSEIVTSPGRVDMLFKDSVGANMLALYRVVASTTVSQAIFDMNLFPLINSNGTTGYDIGASSFLWRDIYWAGKLTQNGTLRLDASGNLTVNSCSGCGGTINGYFVTGKSTVAPPSTATGIQMWFDPSPNYQGYLKVYNNASTLVPLNLSSSVLNLTDGGVTFGTVGNQSVGSGANPGNQAWFLNSLETRVLNLHGPASSDLTGGTTSISSEIVTSPGRVDMLFKDSTGNPMLGLYRVVASTTVNEAIFDMNLFPLINSNGTTGYDVGASSFLWRSIYWAGSLVQNGVTRIDASGNLTVTSCSGCVTTAYLPLIGGTMSGNILANAAGTLSIGSKPTPFGAGYFLNNASTKQLEIYGQSATDLTGGFHTITSDVVVSPSRDRLYFNDTVGAAMLTLSRTVAGTLVSQAIFDMNLFPLINSNGTTGYDVGASSFLWRSIYWAGSLVQNGVTRIDASGNLTVNSCSGCGGVPNGFFITGKTTVNPPSTATGIQMWFDPSPNYQGYLKVYNNAAALVPFNLSASVLNLTDSPIHFGSTIGTLDVGTNTNPGSNAWFLNAIQTRSLNLHGPATSDLSGGATTITSEVVVSPGRVDMLFKDTVGANMLALNRVIAGTTVSQAIFDMNLFPLINSNGTTGYDIGASSFLWRDIYWAGRLIQNGVTRLDASGNLTVNSCSGCSGSGVANGFFVTGQTAVAPPSTAVGLQVYHDPSTHTSFLKSYGASNNITNLDFTGFSEFHQQVSFDNNIVLQTSATITNGAGVPMQLVGSSSTNGNILLIPGAVSGNSFVRISQTTSGQPALKLLGLGGSTAATVFEADDSAGTARFWIEAAGNSTGSGTCANCVHTASVFPATDGTYDLGNDSSSTVSLRYSHVRSYQGLYGLVPTDSPSGTVLQAVQNGFSFLVVDAFAAGGSAIPGLIGRSAGCFQSAPCNTPAAAALFVFGARGYSSGFISNTSASITFKSNEAGTYGPSNQGADILINTTQAGQPAGGTGTATRAVFTSTGMNPASDNTGSLGTSLVRWNSANIVNLTVGSCTGCGGSSFNPAANITFTGSDSFTNVLSLNGLNSSSTVSSSFAMISPFFDATNTGTAIAFENSTLSFQVTGNGDITAHNVLGQVGNFTQSLSTGTLTLSNGIVFDSGTGITAPNGIGGSNISFTCSPGQSVRAMTISAGIVTSVNCL